LKHRIETYTALDKQKDEILKRLGGARDQRIKNIESSKVSFAGLIRMLMDKKIRKAEGRHLALRLIAMEQAAEKLKQPYKYDNGEIDQPMLVPEDVRVFDSEVSNEIESTDNIENFPANIRFVGAPEENMLNAEEETSN